jgi:CDP-glucose 4,6-dehydratase
MTKPAGTGWWNSNILVTGASGFLGSHLTAKLHDAGANVTILERDFTPKSYLLRSGYVRKVNRVRGDVRDYDIIQRTLTEHEIEYVFHLAAQSIVKIGELMPVQTIEQNVLGTTKLLEACRLSGVKRVLVTTSDKAYGTTDNLPYRENYPLQGLHPYACSKSCEDLVTQMYCETYGLSTLVVRCGNMYGPGDLNYSRIIPKTIRNLLTGQPPVIYGNGMMVRDYTYVEDAAEACMFLMQQGNDGAYNVSGEAVYTVKEVIEIISNLMGVDIPPIHQGVNNEIDSQWLDINKIKALGWEPDFTFAEGIDRTIKYYKGVV